MKTSEKRKIALQLQRAAETLQERCDSAYEYEVEDIAMSLKTAETLWRLLRSAKEALTPTQE